MSEAGESENPLQIPTPHFGESYSQSGYSPVMQRSQGRMGSLTSEGMKGDGHAVTARASEEGEYPSHMTSQKSSNSDEGFDDDDTEFVENDAYVTFGAPKFKIVSEERGRVFETVRVK